MLVFSVRSFAGDDTQAVYLDDMMSGFTVAGNTFFNCSRALLLGGGRENTFVRTTSNPCRHRCL